MGKRIVIFGSTGATGSHLVKLALDAGLEVRAFARTPEKIAAGVRANPRLEVFRGDLNDLSAVDKAIEGADFIVSTAGDAKAKNPRMMTELVKQVVTSMRKHGVKRFVFQAGAFSPMPGETLPLPLRIMRPTLGAMLGMSQLLADNDAVMAYLVGEAKDLDWTVTRPANIKDLPSKGTLKATTKPGTTVRFVDLAAFDLAVAQNNENVREAPFPAY